MAYEAEMRILDRSSMDGDRYERRKTRDDRANPRILGRHDRCRLRRADRPIPAARLCRDGVEAIPVFPATQEAARGALRLPATADGLFAAAFVALAGPLSTDEGASPGQSGQPHQLCTQVWPRGRGVAR